MRAPVAFRVPGTGYGVFRPRDRRWHWGVDLPAAAGADVVAPENAEVVAVWVDDATPPWVGYGPAGVLLRGASGPYHLLAHLDADAELPEAGAHLEEGEKVGVVSSLAHVHWELRRRAVDSPSTRRVNTWDPLAWLRTGNLVGMSADGWVWWVLLALVLSRRL